MTLTLTYTFQNEEELIAHLQKQGRAALTTPAVAEVESKPAAKTTPKKATPKKEETPVVEAKVEPVVEAKVEPVVEAKVEPVVEEEAEEVILPQVSYQDLTTLMVKLPQDKLMEVLDLFGVKRPKDLTPDQYASAKAEIEKVEKELA